MNVFHQPFIRRAIEHRPLRFLFVGGLNTAFCYGVFAACLLCGLAPSLSLIVSTLIGVVFNFITSSSLTFQSRDMRRLPAFCLTYAVLFIINLIALRGLIAVGLKPAIAQAVLLLPLAALSYVIQRDLVFRIRPHGGRSA